MAGVVMPITHHRTVEIITRQWVNNVVVAGGSVATRTAAVVSQFVDGCKSDGIWNTMASGFILPFATDGFDGLFVPLVAPSGASFTNNNFVSGDYSLSTGLDPGAGNSSKYMVWNIPATSLFTSTAYHGSFYQRVVRTQGTKVSVVVSFENGLNRFSIQLEQNISRVDFFNDDAGKTTSSNMTPGLLQASYSSGVGRLLRNGTQIASNTISGSLNIAAMPSFTLFGYRASGETPLPQFSDDTVTSYVYIGLPVNTANEQTRVQALQTALGRQV